MSGTNKILLPAATLIFIFCLTLTSLTDLERSETMKPLVSFEMVLFSDTDAEKILAWCERQGVNANLVTPEFGPRKIICKAAPTFFIEIFKVRPVDKLFLSRDKLPASLRSVKWLAIVEN